MPHFNPSLSARALAASTSAIGISESLFHA
jgi:hypothetical protein